MGPLAEIEALGFGALWLGGSPSLVEARAYLEATTTLTVATGILNVWRHEPADVAAGHADLRRDFGDRFLLGVGIGHPEATSEYKKPLAKMRDFLDGLDNADRPVPRDERVVAALGPKMLELAAERSLGAHPYFTPVEHTRFARERIGSGALLAPEVAVVDGGSDRLVDAVIPHGSAEAIAESVHAHLEAGADHVCLQPVGHGSEQVEDYRALARALL